MKRLAPFAGFHTQTALSLGLRTLFKQLQTELELDQPLAVYLAGGMAVHLYTGQRVTTDIDAEFLGRLAIPQDLVLDVTLEDGTSQVLYFDTNYNPMFALMHERYQEDALALDVGASVFQVYVFSALDLAVSKLARYADNDKDDIAALARQGLVTASALRQRAEEALTGYVGGQSMIQLNIDEAVRQIRIIENCVVPGGTP